MLTPVLVFHLTSFNFDGKGVRDVGLNCRCHLSNIMPDNIFSMIVGGRVNLNFFLIKGVVLLFAVGWKRRHSFVTLASVNVHKIRLKEMGSISL